MPFHQSVIYSKSTFCMCESFKRERNREKEEVDGDWGKIVFCYTLILKKDAVLVLPTYPVKFVEFSRWFPMYLPFSLPLFLSPLSAHLSSYSTWIPWPWSVTPCIYHKIFLFPFTLHLAKQRIHVEMWIQLPSLPNPVLYSVSWIWLERSTVIPSCMNLWTQTPSSRVIVSWCWSHRSLKPLLSFLLPLSTQLWSFIFLRGWKWLEKNFHFLPLNISVCCSCRHSSAFPAVTMGKLTSIL